MSDQDIVEDLKDLREQADETEAAEYTRCPDCGGFGATDMIAGDDCERCSGTGKIAADEITRLRTGAPEGWKLVPVEPTEEILVELAELCISAIQETRGPASTLEHFGENIRSAYRAMLEAAPALKDRRRTEVEGVLRDAAKSDRPIFGEELRILADKLSIPDEYRPSVATRDKEQSGE
jgi:hypothetical protein